MAASLEEHKKQFGHCKVKWRIDHFSLQTLQEKKWKIKSPEFTINGSEETMWFMSLRSQDSRVYFNIKRSNIDPSPKYVCLNLLVHSGSSEENSVFCKKMLISVRKGGEYEVYLGSSDCLQVEMDRLNDAFTITCNMIVYNKNASKKRRESNDAGLQLLSENMFHLYKSSQNFDVKLIFGDNVILAHKAILSARNLFVNDDDDDMEDDIEECSTIDFTGVLDYIAMEQVLAYLYTGDIMHVLIKPSFSIYECATYLEISEIEVFYKPDELLLTTSVDVEEHILVLQGYKFEKSSLIWRMHNEGTKHTLQLLFFPNGEGNKSYISLFTRTFEKTMYVAFEFDFIDENGHSFEVRPIVTNTCISEVTNRSMKILNFIDKLFEVTIKVKLSACTKILSIDKNRSVFTSCIDEDYFYECLSGDIECLLDGGPFRDLLIDNNGVYFWAHKCILASRSQFFSDMLDKKEEGEVIAVPNFEPHIVNVILTYVYSGRLLNVPDDTIIHVYEAAEYGKLPHLKSMCSELLKRSFKIDKNIRCRVFRVAEVHEDVPLKNDVLSYLFEGTQIQIPNRLPSSEDVRTCRHCR